MNKGPDIKLAIDKRKILLVSNGFYPELSPRSYRATELAKEFLRQGHAVTVISKFRNHDYSGFIKEFPIAFKMWNKPSFPTVPIFEQKPFSFLSRIFSRLLSLFFEYPGIEQMFHLKKLLRHENGYDLIISFAVPYPVHWGVAWSRSKKHPIAGCWVADCGDPYMGDVLNSFRKPFYFKYLEKWFCRKADFISIPVESAKPGYYPEFHSKIRIIPQGFDFSLTAKADVQLPNRIPEFAYAGGFIRGKRDPNLFMQSLLKIDKPFKFHIYTNQPEFFYEYKLVLNERLIVSEFIDRHELIQRLSKMDFLLNFDNNTLLNVPSKLIDYAITDRPVLNIDKGYNVEDLLAFLNRDYRKRMALPDPQEYHIKRVSELFLGLTKPIY